MRQLTPVQLRAHLDQVETPPLLLDVREPWEFAICRIDGSVNLPMGHIPERLHTLQPERETVVICHHGVRSLQVAYFLEQSGFSQVINLSGGVAAWAGMVDPGMPVY